MTKTPLTLTGHLASVTDPATWTTYEKALASLVGDGIGFVLGDGIGCVDLDDCILEGGSLHPVAQGILDDHPQAMRVEVSVSGRGLHVWDRMVGDAGTVRVIDGQKVETYSRARFIALGEVYRP